MSSLGFSRFCIDLNSSLHSNVFELVRIRIFGITCSMCCFNVICFYTLYMRTIVICQKQFFEGFSEDFLENFLRTLLRTYFLVSFLEMNQNHDDEFSNVPCVVLISQNSNSIFSSWKKMTKRLVNAAAAESAVQM